MFVQTYIPIHGFLLFYINILIYTFGLILAFFFLLMIYSRDLSYKYIVNFLLLMVF